MASSLPPNGSPSSNAVRAHGQANDILQKDASRGNVAVHSFNPDAPPAEKAAAAGNARTQLTSTIPDKPSDSGRGQPSLNIVLSCHAELFLFLVELAVDPGSDDLIPTITIEDVDVDKEGAKPGRQSISGSSNDAPNIPGQLPASKAPVVPDWYKVGWGAFTGLDKPLEDDDQRQLRLMNTWISEQYYGQWYYNAAVIIFVRHSTHISLQRAHALTLLLPR
jgi:hypothetical protein